MQEEAVAWAVSLPMHWQVADATLTGWKETEKHSQDNPTWNSNSLKVS